MDLLVVRHADAGDANEFAETGQPDDLRPLSQKGRKQMRRAASALRLMVPRCDVVFSSPLKRAVETAEILSATYGLSSPDTTQTLIPGAELPDFEHWAADFGADQCVAVVGHEPHLSALIAWLMTATGEAGIIMKKGGACMLEFAGHPRAGEGELRWLLGPRELKLMTKPERPV